MHDGVLLERETQVEALTGCLDRAAGGSGSLLFLEGPAGLGKTTLLEWTTAAAQDKGFVVLTASGSELEASLAFGVAVSLLDSAPAVAGRAHPTTLLRMLEGGSDLDALYALYRRIADLADDRPVLIAVDDGHWADGPSLRWLLFVAQRTADLPVAIVVAARPGEPHAPAELLDQFSALAKERPTVLQPLTKSATKQLVTERFTDAKTAVVDACHSATAGNPFLLSTLLDELEYSGSDISDPSVAAGITRLTPDTVVRTTMRRLAAFGDDATAVARAVALLGEDASLRNVAAVADLDWETSAKSVDAMAEAGLVVSGEPLHFTHPLLRSAVYSAIPPAQVAAGHLRAAEILVADGVEPQRVAAQLLPASRRGQDWVVDQLQAAARDALRGGAPSSAADFLRRALDEPPHPETLSEVLVELGEAETLTGDEQGIQRLERALHLTDDSRLRIETLARLGAHLTELGQHRRAREVFARAVAEPDVPPQTLAALRTAEYSLALTDGSMTVDDIESHLTESNEVAQQASGPGAGPALTQLAVAHVFTCRDADAARDLSLRGLAEMATDSGASLYASSIALSCLIWCEDFDTVEGAISAALDDAGRRGATMSMAYLLYGRSWISFWRGRVADAAADAGTAVDAWSGGWSMHLPGAASWQALALIELGQPEQALARVDRVFAMKAWDYDVYEALLLHARGRALLALGRSGEAAEQLALVGGRPSPYVHNPAVLPWRGDAAIAAAATGDMDTARAMAAEELALARRFGAPRPIGAALRATALVEGSDIGLLTQSVAVLERTPARLELLRSLVDLGAAQHAAGDCDAARETLTRAIEVGATTTATVLRERAAEHLEATGMAVDTTAPQRLDALTPSERRVAQLAAGGATNPQIARDLFVTRKTVEFHLSNAYRKLGVRSRRELKSAFADSASADV